MSRLSWIINLFPGGIFFLTRVEVNPSPNKPALLSPFSCSPGPICLCCCCPFAGPSITSLVPDTVPIVGGTTIQIIGCNLGTPKDPPFAKICENECQKMTWISSTELHCVTPPGYVGSCPVTLSIGASAFKAPGPLKYKCELSNEHF